MILSETCLACKQESDLGPQPLNENLGVVISNVIPSLGRWRQKALWSALAS